MQTLACSDSARKLDCFYSLFFSEVCKFFIGNLILLSFSLFQTIANYKWSSRKRKFVFILCFLPVGTLNTNKCFSITALGWIFGLYLQSLTLIFPMMCCVSKIWDLILFVFRPIATYCEIKTVWSFWCIFWQCQSSQSFEPWGLSLTPV